MPKDSRDQARLERIASKPVLCRFINGQQRLVTQSTVHISLSSRLSGSHTPVSGSAEHRKHEQRSVLWQSRSEALFKACARIICRPNASRRQFMVPSHHLTDQTQQLSRAAQHPIMLPSKKWPSCGSSLELASESRVQPRCPYCQICSEVHNRHKDKVQTVRKLGAWSRQQQTKSGGV